MPGKNEVADIYGSEIYDVPRQRSRCKIIVYSHITENPDDKQYGGIIDCSRDVIKCETSKTIKSGGGANFVLVPRRNYLNYLYPNDYVHIYFDPGDGRGFIRVFFGFVDRVERQINTGETGVTTTRYQVTCSDFTKAFDKTNIYFNPHIVKSRGDFVAQHFAGSDAMGGYALRTKGISIWGTPADIVMSLAQLLLGFGSQFMLPKHHPVSDILVDVSRKKRLKLAKSQLSSDFQSIVGKGSLKEEREKIQARLDKVRGRVATEGTAITSLGPSLGLSETLTQAMVELVLDPGLQKEDEINSDRYTRAERAQQQMYSKVHTLLDMFDFSFVEYNAVDGSILSESIWQSQGTLWSIMNAWSNGMVNELFCDLRLVSGSSKFDLSEGSYANFSDEIKGNEGAGVRTVPAIVMREYPFSTIEGILPPGKVEVLGAKLGAIPISGVSTDNKGAIFSRDVNSPGRKVITITALNPFRYVETQGKATGQKHLDVGVISVRDIISERIGRSDADVFNLLEVYADMGIGAKGKFFANEVQPISTPISIMRNGLRVRTVTTKFARWPTNKFRKDKGGVDSQMARFQTIRWTMMMDHWFQHNAEYLSGSITTRAFPEIRVGYRLDIRERNESYYVEGTNNSWSYTDKGATLITTFTVSRGQRNDPFPVYVQPALHGWGGLDNRNDQSRLAIYFHQRNPSAVARSSILFGEMDLVDDGTLRNLADLPSKKNKWSADSKGYLAADSQQISFDKKKKEAERRRRAIIDTSTEAMLDELGLSTGRSVASAKKAT
jgi:hypothetical protein